MKTFAAALMVFVATSFAVISGQNITPSPSYPQTATEINNATSASQKIDASLLEKVFHLKMTKQKRVNTELVLVFEFTKNIDPDTLDAVRIAFGSTGAMNEKEKDIMPKVYLFDNDNVVLEIKNVTKTSGVITGRSGDAFRVHLDADAAIRKIEFRFDVEFADETDPTPSRRTRRSARRVPSGPFNINR